MQNIPEICALAEEFAHSNGILRKSEDGPVTLPLTLFPSPFPLCMLREAASLQRDINILYHSVSRCHEFLEKTLKPTFLLDDFLHQLWNIYIRVKDEGIVQPVVLGLNRSDYMVHTKTPGRSSSNPRFVDRLQNITSASHHQVTTTDSMWSELSLRQVEVNMIASSFCGLSPRMVSQHRQALALAGFSSDQQKRVLDSDSADGFADALARATDLYIDHVYKVLNASDELNPTVLVVVSEQETNIYDQRALLGSLLLRHPHIRILIRSFSDLLPHSKRLTLDEQRRLFVDGEEIAVIYYRHGYTPAHFPNDETWEVKYQLERSRAIKCPCIQYMLVNTKLVQAALSQSEQLARFVNPKSPNFDRLLATFAPQIPLSDAFEFVNATDIDRVLAECRVNPDKFVLKPQREGGGNNYFGDDIIKQLARIQDSGLGAAYVLMERFHPYVVENHVLGWRGTSTQRQLVCELGIFGAILAREDQIILNEQTGHLLRSKSVDSNEGGIAAGFGCIDSPFLV